MSLEGSYLYGPIDGFVQIPKGGQPGTTSSERPTFEELGIDTVSMGDIRAEVTKGSHGVYAGARLVRSSSNAAIDPTLVSHGTTFPAGAPVDASVQLDWYRIGYEYHFTYAYSDAGTISFAPAAELALLNFSYDLSSPDDLSASRSFTKGTARLGLQAECSPLDRASVAAGLMGSLPISNTPSILTVQFTGGYRLLDRASWGLTGLLGLVYDRLDYEDNQTVPNHIHAEIGPSLQVGLDVRWWPSR